MVSSLHRFVRLLRLFGIRVSVAEAADAMLAAAQPDVLADQETLRAALRVTLIKDRRDDELFDELFSAFFSLRPSARQGRRARPQPRARRSSRHRRAGVVHGVTGAIGPSRSRVTATASRPTSGLLPPGRPRPSEYNLHQEANKIDLASVTDEIVLSKDGAGGTRDAGASVQLETDRLHNPGLPGQLAPATGHRVEHSADGDAAEGTAWLAGRSR